MPGHEVVGVVDALRARTRRGSRSGDRIGIAWLRGTCGRCRWCRTGPGEPCPAPAFTGWDADGGYAEYAVVPEAYAYRLPDALDDVHAAPLLCAGIVGYRALRRAELPPGGRLGIYGFGASAHLVAQVAIAQGAHGARADPLRRGRATLALELGRGLGRARPTRRRPSRWTPRSCSPRPASWCRWRCGRSTRAGRSPSPAST